MNREDAKELSNHNVSIVNGNLMISVLNRDLLIEAIFNYFESRTCGDCKHYFMEIKRDEKYNNIEVPACYLFSISDSEYIIRVEEDFGCNKWRSKND